MNDCGRWHGHWVVGTGGEMCTGSTRLLNSDGCWVALFWRCCLRVAAAAAARRPARWKAPLKIRWVLLLDDYADLLFGCWNERAKRRARSTMGVGRGTRSWKAGWSRAANLDWQPTSRSGDHHVLLLGWDRRSGFQGFGSSHRRRRRRLAVPHAPSGARSGTHIRSTSPCCQGRRARRRRLDIRRRPAVRTTLTSSGRVSAIQQSGARAIVLAGRGLRSGKQEER